MGTITGVLMGIRESLIQSGSMTSSSREQRRCARIKLQVPVFVRGVDAYGEELLELAKTLDISAIGAFLATSRSLRLQEIITLTIPVPSVSSAGLVPAGMQPIQARVRRQEKAGDVHLVGLEFVKPLD
jgi:PilZ domain